MYKRQDQVAASVVREHAQMHRQNQPDDIATAPTPAAVVPSVPVVASTPITAASVAPVVVAAEPAQSPKAAPVANIEIRAEDAVYKGSFLVDRQSGQISGDGRVEFFDGRLFVGRLEAGRKQGFGTYTWATGQRYAGNWRDDQPEGQGEWTSAEGDRYVGGFSQGKREGPGRMVYADKTEYNGCLLYTSRWV